MTTRNNYKVFAEKHKYSKFSDIAHEPGREYFVVIRITGKKCDEDDFEVWENLTRSQATFIVKDINKEQSV